MALRVVVCDHQRVFAEAVAAFLDGCDGVRVTATVFDGDAAVRSAADDADVLLLRLSLAGGCAAFDVLEALRNRGSRCAVLMMDGAAPPTHIAAALAAGARGYCSKDVDPGHLVAYIRKVAAGEAVVAAGPDSPAVALELARRSRARANAAKQLAALTPRERQVLERLADGYTATQIARRLGLRLTTVRTQLRSGFRKLGAGNQLEAAALMRRYREEANHLGRAAQRPAGPAGPERPYTPARGA